MDIAQVKKLSARLSFRFGRLGSIPSPGAGRTSLRGPGLSFIGYREYQYGDDIRSVDWNVAARHGHPVVKLFEQEHASAVVCVVDGSASMRIPALAKWNVARELAMLCAFAAAREGDAVGAVVVTHDVEFTSRPRRGMAHANALARDLVGCRPLGSETRLATGVECALRMLRAPGVIVVVSDFLSAGWEWSVKTASRKHTMFGLNVLSPSELNLPDAGLIHVRDVETGVTRWIDSSSAEVRAAYTTGAAARRRNIKTRLDDAGATPVEILSNQGVAAQLRAICRVRPV